MKTESNQISSSKFPTLLGSRNFISSTHAPFYFIGPSAAILAQGTEDSSLTIPVSADRERVTFGQEVRGLLAMGSDESSTVLAGGETFLPPPPTPTVPLNEHVAKMQTEAATLLRNATTSWSSASPG